MGDAGTSKTVRMYITGAYVGVTKEQFNKIKISGMNTVTLSPQITQNSRPARLQNRICSEQQLYRTVSYGLQMAAKCFCTADRDGAKVGCCRVRPSTALRMVQVSCSTISMFVTKQSQVVQSQATNSHFKAD